MAEPVGAGDGRRFEDTMDVLEAEREVTEGRFRELLAELTAHVADVGRATGRSANERFLKHSH